ncbi:MAG: GerMN domain-containing protein [Actinobacteria bacterium]|nr:GerMN domain-containing protein [Actinomycetota bacterium]
MQDKEQLLRKKPKKKKRFAGFVFMLVIFIIIISLVFYSIENPSFIKNSIAKLKSFYTSETTSPDAGIETETFSEESEDAPALEEPGDLKEAAEKTAEQESKNITGKAKAFWQKILSFFIKGLKRDENDFPSSIEIKVFFASLGQEDKFSYEQRTIVAGNAKIAVENAIKELLEGPHKSFNFPVIPPGTELKGVDIYENLAKVDFSQKFLENSLESGVLDRYVIYTIVNTVTQIPDVDGVIFLIEGKRIKIYGSVDLSIPAIMDEDFISQDNPLEKYSEDLTNSQADTAD